VDVSPSWGSIEGGRESASPSNSSSSSKRSSNAGGGVDLDTLGVERAALVGQLEDARNKMRRAEDEIKVVGELEDMVATAEGLRSDNERLRAERETRVPIERYQQEVGPCNNPFVYGVFFCPNTVHKLLAWVPGCLGLPQYGALSGACSSQTLRSSCWC
jgi:hypothetical protein